MGLKYFTPYDVPVRGALTLPPCIYISAIHSVLDDTLLILPLYVSLTALMLRSKIGLYDRDKNKRALELSTIQWILKHI